MNRSKSFTQALKEKYCLADEVSLPNFDCVIQFKVSKAKDTSDGQAELGHLRNVVLANQGISHAGIPSAGLNIMCPNVIDLDLSGNQLVSWHEILSVISQLYHLKYLNLARNHIKDNEDILRKWKRPFPQLENFVLNGTFVGWFEINCLTQLMPRLTEFHICGNRYSKIEEDELCGLKKIKILRMNDNLISSWNEVWKLRHLPKLHTLILSGNPLESVFYKTIEENCEINETEIVCMDILEDVIGDVLSTTSDTSTSAEQICREIVCDTLNQVHHFESASKNSAKDADLSSELPKINGHFTEDEKSYGCDTSSVQVIEQEMQCEMDVSSDQMNKQCSCGASVIPFENLHTLQLSNTLLNSWEDLQALSSFPCLKTVRMKDVQHLHGESSENRRKMFVACLPNINNLNGSDVRLSERDIAERHFLRYFLDNPSKKPDRYQALEKKHGKMKELVPIDLSFGYKEFTEVSVVCQGAVISKPTLHVLQPVGKLRTFLAQDLGIPRNSFRILHKPCGPYHQEESAELTELFLSSLPLSRFDIYEGDEIHVEIL